jgi:hypothetical protein
MVHDMGGPTFIYWSGGKPPKDKRTKCSVCGTRWSTLLCDGPLPAQTEIVFVRGRPHTQSEQRTCDAPLCEACTTRPAEQPIALPDFRDGGHMNGMHVLQTERRVGLMRMQGKPRRNALMNEPPPDTKDFCPACVKRMDAP